MNQHGFIKISRKIFRDASWIEPREFSRFEAWLDCIQMAQWKSATVDGVRLERGEFLTSIRTLAHRWHWGERRVRTFIAEATQQTTRLKTQRETQEGTVYLVVKYDDYQGTSNENDTAHDTAKDTRTQPRKEEEQIKNNYIVLFAAAWATYPKRLGGNPKRRALEAWQARIREGVDPEVMLAGVRRYAAFCESERKVGTPYVQHAATFFGPSRPFEEAWECASSDGRILTAAGNPILSLTEFREQSRRELEEINRLRAARGEAPLAIA